MRSLRRSLGSVGAGVHGRDAVGKARVEDRQAIPLGSDSLKERVKLEASLRVEAAPIVADARFQDRGLAALEPPRLLRGQHKSTVCPRPASRRAAKKGGGSASASVPFSPFRPEEHRLRPASARAQRQTDRAARRCENSESSHRCRAPAMVAAPPRRSWPLRSAASCTAGRCRAPWSPRSWRGRSLPTRRWRPRTWLPKANQNRPHPPCRVEPSRRRRSRAGEGSLRRGASRARSPS
eukprot:4616094-Prymnesium_polylepis.2